jgi:hypothetical protein
MNIYRVGENIDNNSSKSYSLYKVIPTGKNCSTLSLMHGEATISTIFVETIKFPDDETALLWFKLNY